MARNGFLLPCLPALFALIGGDTALSLCHPGSSVCTSSQECFLKGGFYVDTRFKRTGISTEVLGLEEVFLLRLGCLPSCYQV
ncbi:hypothetical protein R1flu_025549 [Riccia fluitans]|uniref:Uncharacterized protein n=1 Tax=Riccia fluitans TaxID=41844 RepID=A0ABD1XY92_9MARC